MLLSEGVEGNIGHFPRVCSVAFSRASLTFQRGVHLPPLWECVQRAQGSWAGAPLGWRSLVCFCVGHKLAYYPPGSSVHGDSPGKNTGVGCHALLQGIFPTQGLTRVSCVS